MAYSQIFQKRRDDAHQSRDHIFVLLPVQYRYPRWGWHRYRLYQTYNNNGRDCKHIAHNLCHFRLSGTVARNEATKNIAAVLSVFGGTNERKALSMAENYTNNTLILTFDGEYLTNDKDLFIAPDEIICYINTTGCRDQKIEEMKSIIASADWETFCAACECYNSHFTVSELIDFVNEMDEHFILLPHIHTLEDLGEFIFDNHWDSSKYAKIRYHINFESIGHDMVVAGEAAETTYGYMIMLW